MQIGKPGQSKGSNDIENLKGAGQDLRRPEDQRAVRRRRLRQQSRDRVRRRHRQVQAALGRLRPQARRHQPRDRTIPDAPPAQQFRNPVHCAELSNDGLLYVCDRVNDRIQVFKPDGTFVKEDVHREEHAGRRLGVGHRLLEGSAAEVHLSGRWREREGVHHAARHARNPDQLRRRRTPARPVLRGAQHRHRFEGQHLHHRDLSRASACRSSSTKAWRR